MTQPPDASVPGMKLAAICRVGSKERQPIRVRIVAARAETLDDLHAYLSLAGFATRTTHRLGGADADPCSAIVFFPDEFSLDDVLRELCLLRRHRPRVVPLVITCRPARYVDIVDAAGKVVPPIVIPKPAWGWMIVDAIRAGMAFQAEHAGDQRKT